MVLFRVACLLNNGQYGERPYARHSTITLSAENTTKLNFAAKTVTTNNLFPLLFPRQNWNMLQLQRYDCCDTWAAADEGKCINCLLELNTLGRIIQFNYNCQNRGSTLPPLNQVRTTFQISLQNHFYMKSCQTIEQFQASCESVHDELFYYNFSELSHF